MKAIVCTRYGPPEVLQLQEVKTPTPTRTQVRIKILVIFDAVGRKKSARALVDAERALAPGGKVTAVDDSFPRPKLADLLVLKELAESGALKPVIDRTYPLEEMVEAHRYVDGGHKKGNVIIRVEHPGKT